MTRGDAGLIRQLAAVIFWLMVLVPDSPAVISDRVVAFVEDDAITASELDAEFERSRAVFPHISRAGVLETMINRKLLLREAARSRIEGKSPEEAISDYIDLKIRAFIRVSDSEIEKFYGDNLEKFAGRPYDDAKEEIERYLSEKALNDRLAKALMELRERAYVKILLVPE